MGKALCFGALGVGALMLVVFLLDLAIAQPFGGGGGGKDGNPFLVADILGLLGSAAVIYLGWNAYRDLK